MSDVAWKDSDSRSAGGRSGSVGRRAGLESDWHVRTMRTDPERCVGWFGVNWRSPASLCEKGRSDLGGLSGSSAFGEGESRRQA